ncbi:MAG: tetratricopeptide repeat protein [Ignavibacteria bacterium]
MKKIILLLFISLTSVINLYSQENPQTVYRNGIEKFFNSDFDLAITYFTDYIKTETQAYEAYNYRGLCYLAQKNYAKAKEDFSSAVHLNKSFSQGFVNRANIFALQGDYDAALRDYNNAILADRANLEIYYGLSLLYINSKEFNKALIELKTAAALAPKNARVYLNTAIVNMLIGDTLRIFENVDEALYWDSSYLYTNLNKSLIFTIADRFHYALQVLNSAVSANPNSYLVYFNRGVIFYMMGNFPDAISNFNRSKDLYKGGDQRIINLITKITRISKFNS